ncbi:GLABROUS1 enhancer-binding protein-like [Tasmannia lanceolata]|uniref:GLABROUS1 enhancer-binding protein-like n=1 Tax=Tasmannia lanceolata TaxID=3420 RepID=UPI0040637BEB
MPPKRPTTVPNPPPSFSSTSGSEEEEEEETSSPPPPKPQEKPSDEEDEEESSDETHSIKPSQPKEQSKSESGESESESDSESDSSPQKPDSHRAARAADPNIKPINSKPLDDVTKSKKPAAKRSLETSKIGNDSKRRKASNERLNKEDEPLKKQLFNKEDEPLKKQLFQRLWSEEDEIAILKGMVEYIKKGSNPTADKEGFHSFIKESLHIEVSKRQITEKISRLKKRYETNLKRGAKGKVVNFTEPHEKMAYDLSKRLWGSNADVKDEDEMTEANGGDLELVDMKASGGVKAGNSRNQNTTEKSFTLPKSESPKDADDVVHNGFLYSQLSRNLNMSSYNESILKKGLNLIESADAKRLEERWKKLHMIEMDVYRQRSDLIKEQMDLIFDALKSSHL